MPKATRPASKPAGRPATRRAWPRDANKAMPRAWPRRARTEGAAEAQRLHALVQSCAVSIGALEEKMGQGLLTLALDIAQQVVRTTLAEQPDTVAGAVREVLHINPTAGGQMRLWANPEDIELIRLHLADELGKAIGAWADESIARGCRAETPFGDIDATLQTRWRRVAASLGRNVAWEDPRDRKSGARSGHAYAGRA